MFVEEQARDAVSMEPCKYEIQQCFSGVQTVLYWTLSFSFVSFYILAYSDKTSQPARAARRAAKPRTDRPQLDSPEVEGTLRPDYDGGEVDGRDGKRPRVQQNASPAGSCLHGVQRAQKRSSSCCITSKRTLQTKQGFKLFFLSHF